MTCLCPPPCFSMAWSSASLSNKETDMPRMNGLSAFSSLSADPGQSSLFPVESSLCQPKAFNITFISQIKNLKPRKDNDVQKASLQILAKDLEIFQNTRCRGALGAHSLELLIDSLKVCYSPDSLYFQGVQAMWEKSTGKVTRVAEIGRAHV